jgi:radical SAM superfamily enzyme YgiQ (UPF0313 family)
MTAQAVLLSLDWLRGKDPRRSLGHASILARLRAIEGVATTSLEFAVNSPGFRRECVLASVLAAAAADEQTCIAIGAYVWNDPDVQWLLPALRRSGFRGSIVLGGPQISYAPPGIDEKYPDADFFVRGYGEDALVRLLQGADPIPGVTRRGLDRTSARAEVDLLALPSPYLSGSITTSSFVRWETQRGCPYSCAFCQHLEAGAKLPLRKLSQERIDAEIELFVARGVQDIAVLDPVFNDDPVHAVRVLHRLACLGYSGRLSLQCRFEDVTPDFLDACQLLNVCLEFGLQTIQPAEMKAIRRKNHLATVESVISQLRSRAIDFEVSLIYGLPQQTVSSFRTSVEWCLTRGVPTVRVFPLMLLRGTPMERDRARWRLVENDEAIPLVVESNTFSRSDWAEMRRIAEQLSKNAVHSRSARVAGVR